MQRLMAHLRFDEFIRLMAPLRFDEFMTRFPHHVDLPYGDSHLPVLWIDHALWLWLKQEHPTEEWSRIILRREIAGEERFFIRYGFTTMKTAVHFALRWKGEP